jgi:hypothetical protein
MWLKLLLTSEARLAEGYRCVVGGTDEELLETFGIAGGAVIAFAGTERPTYEAFEAWFSASATKLSNESIDAFNEHLLAFEFNARRRDEWLVRFGLDGVRYTSAVLLNQLDDWAGAREQLHTIEPPVVPLIGSRCAGPIGLRHLPRFWWKLALRAAGKLDVDADAGADRAFDGALLSALGLGRADLDVAFEARIPDYIAFEEVIRERAGGARLSPDLIETFNANVSAATIRRQEDADWLRFHEYFVSNAQGSGEKDLISSD